MKISSYFPCTRVHDPVRAAVRVQDYNQVSPPNILKGKYHAMEISLKVYISKSVDVGSDSFTNLKIEEIFSVELFSSFNLSVFYFFLLLTGLCSGPIQSPLLGE
jgi:hypothetical protein